MNRAGMSLSDPTGSSTLIAALSWIQGTLLGTAATIVAILAIASIGFMMLSGRLELRHGVRMVLGCFILFGASTIAGGIQAALTMAIGAEEPMPREAAGAPPVADPPLAPPANTDPYAGASTLTR